MRQLQYITTVLIVWTTAASTLLASVPHFVCRCPDGSIKHFCFGTGPGETSSCCTGQSCCGKKGSDALKENSSGEHGKPKPYCCSQQTRTPKKPTPVAARNTESNPVSGPVFKSAGCQKTLEQSEVQPLPRMNTDTGEIHITDLNCLPEMDSPIPAASAPSVSGIWQIRGLPPPTDFVTTLHRLTI